jgi:tRNA pseudouridine38-40 synthase
VGSLKFKLTVAYDGASYHGWQSQKSGRGVQDQLESAMARLFGADLARSESASRTDTGVHAYGMAVHVEIPAERFQMPENRFALALNACLPADVRVRSARRMPAAFHARFDAIGKQYRYHVWNHPVMNPLLRQQAWHIPRPLNLGAMQAAAAQFVGRHDFRAFTSHRAGELGDSCRTLTRCSVKRSGSHFTFCLAGEGFLYKMCRGIVGTLVEIGRNERNDTKVAELLAQRDRRLTGMNAPAHGLVLWKVLYPTRR